ncbi:DUF2007 domain-containing protein [bacterium]|nr:MAG: DUF2007 domain-containing protein [bacterium]
MRLIFTSTNSAEVSLFQGLLEQEGIECFTRHDELSLTAGSVPFLEVMPELWVARDEDEPKAVKMLEQWRDRNAVVLEAWTCPQCGEENEGQFGACWKCGYEIDGQPANPEQRT